MVTTIDRDPSPNGPGVFVCLEGIDGAGKTTAIAAAGGLLQQRGIQVAFFDKKDVDLGSAYAERHMTALRELIWGHPPDDPYLELGDLHWVHLQAAWYSALAVHKVGPLLRSGHVVMTDTWTHKFLAKLRMRPEVDFDHARSAFSHLPQPDLVIRLAIDPAVAAARKERFTRSDSGNHEGAIELSAKSFTDYQKRLSKVLDDFTVQWGWESVDVTALTISQVGQAVADAVARHVATVARG
jgi:thymidylate kinase